MKKYILLFIIIVYSDNMFSQVGINTETPVAALDITSPSTAASDMLLKVSSTNVPQAFTILNNGNIGMGTLNPSQNLDISGGLRIGAPNVLTVFPDTVSPLLITSAGIVSSAPRGYSKVVGGFRPAGAGVPYTIATIDVANSITRMRFVCYVDNSNEANNSTTQAYTYGDFVIVGLPTVPARFVDLNIKGYDGAAKPLTVSTDTQIAWSNNSQGTTTISINQATGEITIRNTVVTLSYFFEIMGGI